MQLGLAIVIPDAHRLSPVSALCDDLCMTPEEAKAAVESGAIPHVWDLSMDHATRATLRIWRPTRRALAASAGKDPGAVLPIDQLLEQLLPWRNIRTTEIERWWCISAQHVGRFVQLGKLRPVVPVVTSPPPAAVPVEGAAGLLPGRGPCVARVLQRDSVLAFLRSRAVGAENPHVAA